MTNWWKRAALIATIAMAVCVVTFGVVRHANADAVAQTFVTQMDISGQPVGDPTMGQCAGETMTISSGSVLVRGSDIMTSTGSFEGTFDVIVNGLATGDVTGAQYTVSATSTMNFNYQPGMDFTAIYQMHITGAGPDNNTVWTVTTHMTVDANGNVRATSNTWSISCQ